MTDRVLTPRDWLTLTEEVVRLRAERDLLRAEVRAWRKFDWENWTEDQPRETSAWKHGEAELLMARAAVDAFDEEPR